MTQPRWLTSSEAAPYFGVHPSTLKRWAEAGSVPAFRTPGGQWKFNEDTVKSIVAAGSLPVEEATA